jgi:hypothetical protein
MHTKITDILAKDLHWFSALFESDSPNGSTYQSERNFQKKLRSTYRNTNNIWMKAYKKYCENLIIIIIQANNYTKVTT